MAGGACSHIEAIESLKPTKRVCEECVPIGARWVHLRTCQTCGVTAAATTRPTSTPPSTRTRAAIR